MAVKNKIAISVATVAVVMAALFIGLWLGGVFGLSPVAKTATLAQLAGRDNISSNDVKELRVEVFGSCRGEYALTDSDGITEILSELSREKYESGNENLAPGNTVSVSIVFTDGGSFTVSSRGIKHGNKYFVRKDLNDFWNGLTQRGIDSGAVVSL